MKTIGQIKKYYKIKDNFRLSSDGVNTYLRCVHCGRQKMHDRRILVANSILSFSHLSGCQLALLDK